MLTFLAVVFVVVAVTYFFSKKMLVDSTPLMKPLPRVVETEVVETKQPEVEVVKVKKPRKKTAPKSKKPSAKKKAE